MQAHDLGAYCKSCNKVVHDLSALDTDGLLRYSDQYAGEQICANVQVAALQPSLQLHLQQQTIEQRRFLIFGMALIVVFGPLLFSCNEEEHQQVYTYVTEAIAVDTQIETEEIENVTEEKNVIADVITNETKLPLFEIDSNGVRLDEVVISGSYRSNVIVCSMPISTAGNLQFIKVIKKIEIDTTPLPGPIVAPIMEDLTLAVYPNPARFNVTVDYTIYEPGMAVLSVFNINGQHVTDLLQTTTAEPGTFTTSLDVSNYVSGMYIIILVNNEKKQVFKMAVTH